MRKIGMDDSAIEAPGYGIAAHDLMEFNQLARILQAVYSAYGHKS